jgi:hypothetical protein
VTFPCTYVLEPRLVRLFYSSPFYFSLLLTVIATDLKILHSFLFVKYINHIHLPLFYGTCGLNFEQ